MRVESASPSATERLGRALGRLLLDGDLVLLSGELGSGKTRFVKGLAAGFGAARADEVVSPTFLRVEQYRGAGGRCLRHIDAYRMEGPSDLESLGAGDLLGPGGATAVEWPERVEAALPSDGVLVAFRHGGPRRRVLDLRARGPRGRSLLRSLAAARRKAEGR